MRQFFVRKNLVLLTILFKLILFENTLFSSPFVQTKQLILPNNFGYFENLYFINRRCSFIAYGDDIDFQKAVYLDEDRGCTWINSNGSGFPPSVDLTISGTTIFVFERLRTPFHFYHFFHCLEHLLGIWNFGAEMLRDEVKYFVINGGSPKPGETLGVNNIPVHLIKALFPRAEIKLWNDFLKETRMQTLRLEKVITSDRCMDYVKKEPFKTDRLLGGYFQFLTKDSIDSFVSAIYAYVQCQPALKEKLRVTYLKRSLKRILSPMIEQTLINKIKSISNVDLQVFDFSDLTFNEQVNIVANTDVFLGIHGNGLSHTLFLPKGSTLIELFPKDNFRVEYRILAKLRDVNYYGLISDRGLIDDETIEKFGVFGYTIDNDIDCIDIDKIVNIIEDSRDQLLNFPRAI